jgi:hypothetical protein
MRSLNAILPTWCKRPAASRSCSTPCTTSTARRAGAYWDGGITDYHLHLDYRPVGDATERDGGVVLYPHFQRAVVPGWLDKSLKWRHRSTHFLDDVIVLAPNPEWVATLPNAKLPDRTDFTRYAHDLKGRIAVWQTAVAESERLRDEFAEWVAAGANAAAVHAL